MLKTFSEFINESSNRILFHFTDGGALKNILESNTLTATVVGGSRADVEKNDGYPYMVSFSTSGSGAVGYGRSLSKWAGKVTLEFDASKLRNLGKIVAVDYWRSIRNAATDLSLEDKTRYDEQEERLLLNKPQIHDISKYITDIYYYVGDIKDEKWVDVFNACWGIATARNINFWPFEDEGSYNLRMTKRTDVNDDRFKPDVFNGYVSKESHTPQDDYTSTLENLLIMWKVWDDSRVPFLLNYLSKSPGVRKRVARYAHADITMTSFMERFRKMFAGEGVKWKEAWYMPDGIRMKDMVSSFENDIHNTRIWVKYPTMRYLLDLVIKDIQAKGDGDLKTYITRSLNKLYGEVPDQYT